jgi:flagellar assembly protein FliH
MVMRNRFTDSDLQPYRELDVRLLLLEHSTAPMAPIQPPEGAAEVSDGNLEPRLPLSAFAPLVLLAAAQMQAEEIGAQARKEAEALQQEAYTQGVTIGREEGREEMQGELRASLLAFDSMQQNLKTLEEQLIIRLTPDIVRLALDISEKVIGARIEADPQTVALVLDRARAEVTHACQVNIWLHPADYETLQALRPDLVHVGEEGGRTVAVFTSSEVTRGGCRLETELGTVDATIPVQLEEIRGKLLEEG